MTELPDFKKIEFPSCPAIPLKDIVPDAPPEVSPKARAESIVNCVYLQAVDLMKRMLVYNSKHRISANEVSHTILSCLPSERKAPSLVFRHCFIRTFFHRLFLPTILSCLCQLRASGERLGNLLMSWHLLRSPCSNLNSSLHI